MGTWPPAHGNERWSTEHHAYLVAHPELSDDALATQLGRSKQSIHTRRYLIEHGVVEAGEVVQIQPSIAALHRQVGELHLQIAERMDEEQSTEAYRLRHSQ